MNEWGRSRFVWDHDLGCLVEVTEGSNREPPKPLVGPGNLMKDIDNYKAIGIQDPYAPRGTPLIITKGRRQHRDELRARAMSEVGNDRNWTATPPQKPPAAPVVREAFAQAGFYDGARSIRELKRQGR